MKDCPAFHHASFWSPDWNLNSSEWDAQGWITPLRQTFGLPPETRKYLDTFENKHHSYEIQTIEIVLPLTATSALVWQTYDTAQERVLLLREAGEPDATLGWLDSQGHPYCLRPQEAILLGTATTKRPDWKDSPVPLLLLDSFVALTSEAEATLWTAAKCAALSKLGIAKQGGLEVIGREEAGNLQEQLGNFRVAYRQGGETFHVAVQGGICWHLSPDQDWQLIAHKAWDTIRHMRDFDWPVPCHTIRSATPYHFFTQAAAEVAQHKDTEEVDPDWPIFPFARFKRLMDVLGRD